jgi:heparin binding hemagglutinin HbhA
MSIVNDVRSYADAALEQGKTAFSQASTAVSGAIDDLPTLRPAAATEPVLAALGAADLVASSVTKRVETLPAGTLANLAKVQESGKARVSKAQQDAVVKVGELRSRFDARVASMKGLDPAELESKAKAATVAYLNTAKSLYETLAARGETRLADLRNDPRLSKVLGDVSGAVDQVESRVRPVRDQVESRVRPVVDQAQATVSPVIDQVVGGVKAAAAKAPAFIKVGGDEGAATVKAPAKKAPARKAPAKKAPAKKAPAAAKKAPAKKAPAKHAPAEPAPVADASVTDTGADTTSA